MKFRFALPFGELSIIAALTAMVMVTAAVWQIAAPGNAPPTYYGTDMIVHGNELFTKEGIKIADWEPAANGQDGRWKMLTPQQIYDQQQR